MRRALFVAAALALLPIACAKGPAEAALKAADQAIESARPEVEKFVPEEFKSLTESAKAAHEAFGERDYKAALAAAQEIPAKVQAALEAAKRKKEELAKVWDGIKDALPGLVDGFKSKVETFAALKKLPKGFDASQLEAAKTELTGVTEAWTTASSAFDQGDIASAVAKATTLKARVEAAIAGLPELPPAKKKK